MDAARKNAEPVADEWMSQPQAATELGCSRHKVLGHVARSELVAGTVAGRTVISRESVKQLKAKTRTPRRPS